jgi:hypothetical protein
MKLFSSRENSHDKEDILFLLNKLNIDTKENATKILLKYYDRSEITFETIRMINLIFTGKSSIKSDNDNNL